MKTVTRKVAVRWYCGVLDRYVSVASGAIALDGVGWICDCGRWVLDGDGKHSVTNYGKREVYVS